MYGNRFERWKDARAIATKAAISSRASSGTPQPETALTGATHTKPGSARAHVDEVPDAGGWRAVLRCDLPASFVVFLIAIPLSLGIAAASGAPLMSGIVAAVVGGVVAGAIGGARLQVTGPAAGLTVIVAGVIAEFGWAGTCAIVAMAGLVQAVLGISRIGRAALTLSPAVVHGMLAGIGVVIALSQIHVVLGGAPQSSAWANLRDLPAQLIGHHEPAVLVGMITIVVLLVWPRVVRVSFLPAALGAVVLSTAVATFAGLDLPRVDLPDDPLRAVALPRWPDASLTAIAVAVLTIAIVASVESLLSARAIDKLHGGPSSNLDRELVAQGAANTISGMLGGLPVTGVIVRGSANVSAGARTRASAILHGVWVALAVLFCSGVLELIPMSALAAVLVVVGVRLVNLTRIRAFLRHRELLAYLVTVLGVVFVGLLEGVLLGMAIAVAAVLYRLARCDVSVERVDVVGVAGPGGVDHTGHLDRTGSLEPPGGVESLGGFGSSGRVESPGGVGRVESAERVGDRQRWRVRITGTLLFLGVSRLATRLRALPPGHDVNIELHLDFLDHAAFEAIEEWRLAYERQGGRVRVEEAHDTWFHRAVTGRLGDGKSLPRSLPRWFAPWSRWLDASAQSAVADPMTTGVAEFERTVAPLVRPLMADLVRHGQQPDQLFITCADSRLVPNVITASGPGDLFCLRNVGNIVPPYGSGGDHCVGAAVEYAVDVLRVNTITVCGHSECGAMGAILNGSAGEDSALRHWLRQSGLTPLAAVAAEHAVPLFPLFAHGPDLPELTPADRLCLANVRQQLDNLLSYPCVRDAVLERRLRLVGMYFDLAEARMYRFQPAATPLPTAGTSAEPWSRGYADPDEIPA